MSNQSRLNCAIRLATALALLAAVVISPLRPAIRVLATDSSQVDCLRRNFGMPGKAGTTHHRPHSPVTSRVVQVKALSSQHKLDWTSGSVPHRIDLAYAPSLGPGRHSTDLGLDHTAHPLRC